jgi:prepilin-type N-terminal cleavage/methylation domain-containing protein
VNAIVKRLRSAGTDDGFTIVEVMVAMVVFALIAGGVATGIVSTMYLTQDNRSRETALNLASADITSVRSDDDVFSVTGSTTTKAVGSQNFTVKRTTSWITSSGADSTCGAGSGQLSYKRVNVTVSWQSSPTAAPRSVKLDTLVAPPSSVNTANASTIVVGVQTATGGPNQGVSVTISPVSGSGAVALNAQPAATDSDGCTYALNVTPGKYTITINKAGNIVPPGDQTSYTLLAAAGSVASKSFWYDQPASITMTYATNAGTTATLPTGFAGALRHGDTIQNVTAATNSVFPYQDGWTGLGGAYSATCTDVDPTTWPTANKLTYDPKILGDPIGGTPGGSATASIAMGVVGVQLKGSDTVMTATVKNTSAVKNGDPGCSPSMTYTFTGLSAKSVTNIALPYGTWTLLEGTSTTNAKTAVATISATPTASNVTVSVASTNVVTLDPRVVPVAS